MAGVGHRDAGAPAYRLDVEGLLLRAALLAGYGARARSLAQRLAAATVAGDGRSCFEAGTPLQLSVDAPGPAGLRVGLRLPDDDAARALDGLVPSDAVNVYARMLAALPPAAHAGLGTWLFWTEKHHSIFVDLRDRSPAAALDRLHEILSPAQRHRLDKVRPPANDARPWVFRCTVHGDAVVRLHVHWLLARHVEPRKVADAIAPGGFDAAMEVLGHLVRRPGASGRFVVVTPLDEHSEPALRIGNTGWLLTPEDDDKQRAIGGLMAALRGPRDYAEALWSLCEGAAAPDWRVGRACEFKVTAGSPKTVRARLFFSPDVQACATAGTSRSPEGTASMAPSDADPSMA
jgi:hypothetical protein